MIGSDGLQTLGRYRLKYLKSSQFFLILSSPQWGNGLQLHSQLTIQILKFLHRVTMNGYD